MSKQSANYQIAKNANKCDEAVRLYTAATIIDDLIVTGDNKKPFANMCVHKFVDMLNLPNKGAIKRQYPRHAQLDPNHPDSLTDLRNLIAAGINA